MGSVTEEINNKKRKITDKVVGCDQNVASSVAEEDVAVDQEKDMEQFTAEWWDGFSQKLSGRLKAKGLDKFESLFKISRKTFNYICLLVKGDFESKPYNFRTSSGILLTLSDQVAMSLRRLCSGETLKQVGNAFGANQSTVSKVTWRFVEVMEKRALHHIQWPTEAVLGGIKSKFEKIRGLPNCCGAIDTTHILMSQSHSEEYSEVWCDREKNHSMVLQAIVDPDMRFRDIFTGWPGSLNDSMVFGGSGFFKLCEKGKRLNGESISLPEGSTEVNEYLIGDSGFPLLPWLLTPYQGHDLSESNIEFNKRHFATRMVAERALARLKEMCKILQGTMFIPDKHKLPRIIFVCCLLHNIVIDLEDEMQDEMPLSHHHDPGYRQQICESAGVNSSSILRDRISLHLVGSVRS